jgi:hypothetical protein
MPARHLSDLGLTKLEVWCLSAHAVDGVAVGVLAGWRGVRPSSVSRALARARRKLSRRRRRLNVSEGTGRIGRRVSLPADY